MEVSVIIGYFMAVVIGFIIGSIGGGGAILTVPVLTYLIGLSATVATGYALFIVGIASIFGAINHIARKLVDFKVALAFGLPAVAAVYLARLIVVPAIPSEIMTIGNWVMTRDFMLMIILALLIFGAAISMIATPKPNNVDTSDYKSDLGDNVAFLGIQGAVLGGLSGLVGVGGGFMTIPALVLLSKLPMKIAIGTSLVIATAISLMGFVGEMSVNHDIDYTFLFSFTGLTFVGIFIGNYVSKRASNTTLQKGFGWFVVAVGIYIIINEIVGP